MYNNAGSESEQIAGAKRPVDRRWEIAEIALECRGRVVASVLRSYPKVSRDRIEELYDKVWERATQQVGEPAAFPEVTFEKVEPWLRAALIGELRHEVTDRHSHTKRVSDPVVLELQVDHSSDPAGTVEQRLEFVDLMRTANESLTERTKTYIGMTRIEGLSRAEFRERTGWNQKRIQRARKEWAAFAARVRDGAMALVPAAWLKRLFVAGGDGASSGVLGGKVLATCGVAAVCVGGAAGVVEVKRQIDRSKQQKSARVERQKPVAAVAQPVVHPTPRANEAPVSKPASKPGADKPKPKRDKKQSTVEQEFGPQSLPATEPTTSSGGGSSKSRGDGSSGGSSSGGTSSSFGSEFSP